MLRRLPIQILGTTVLSTTLFAGAMMLSGCSSSDSFFGRYEVTNVNVLSDDIDVGESARAEVFFETRLDNDGEPDGIEVVAYLTPSLRYVEGTARIYDDSTDESDPRTPDRVVRCADNSSFVVFRFTDSELEDRSISGASDFGLKFEVLGVSRDSFARVEAAAGEEQEFGCDQPFGAEEAESVRVQ